ncbi:hypothetical protein BH10PLA2_BH10PLA2_13180 [soil metagenome]
MWLSGSTRRDRILFPVKVNSNGQSEHAGAANTIQFWHRFEQPERMSAALRPESSPLGREVVVYVDPPHQPEA